MSDIPNLSYDDLLQLIARQYNTNVDNVVDILNKYNVPPGDMEETFKLLNNTPYEIWYNSDGTVRSTVYNATGSTTNMSSDIASSINSNTTTTKTSFNIPISSNVEKTSETVSKINFKTGMKQAGSFVFGEVAPAIAATATGITLGKTVDSLLYNANPDFWDEHGMSTLNPDTWSSITSGDTSAEATLFNFIYGIDANNNTTQAYIDQNALAYMALYLKNIGVFDSEENTFTNENLDEFDINSYKCKFIINFTLEPVALDYHYTGNADGSYYSLISKQDNVYVCINYSSTYSYSDVYFVSKKPFTINNYYSNKDHVMHSQITKTWIGDISWYVGQTLRDDNNYKYAYIYGYNILNVVYKNNSYNFNMPSSSGLISNDEAIPFAALFYGNGIEKTIGGVEGIGTQEDAKTPDLSNAETVEDVLNALKSQYPELFDNAVTQDVVQPDGSVQTYTYVPVAMPDIDEYGNPITSTSTQSDPQVQPETATKTLLDLITKIIQRDPPTNPPDTGDGDTPPVVPPSGSASSLYAIYNPTLSQINAFGAWLWSDDFVDQIKKLFNDPMQAIIGLHKVYATPATGGSQNIKVGYLDSGVSAKVVSNQYTTIDCGTVRLSEQYHNVFDYSPYTEVNLYLPFIGIVNINVADVMRSSIHIVYHVDVLSGACLAEVKVTRDSAGGTLYQYAGNASVTLPISSGSYMGIVSAVAGVAGGIAGTIASGGSALPLLASSAGAMFNAHTRVEHSGGFSGNAGAMGGKIPYLIISRPQTELADGFENYIGYPSNFTATIGSCTGFIKVIECHLENTTATNSELNEIDTILKEGVLI